MAHNTTRLGLIQVDGTDAVSVFPAAMNSDMATLDNAAIYTEGTLVGRPAASSVAHGTYYRTTDTGAETLSWTDGTNWFPLGLIPVATSTSGSAVSGQAVITTGSSAVTITLPTATQGAMVAVTNRTTNVATVAGSNIQGIGLSSASSFPLGTVGASVVLLSDGTNWVQIAGRQDSGWLALSLGSGVSVSGGLSDYTPAARLDGDTVRLCGTIANTSGSSIGAGSTIFTLPSASMYPAHSTNASATSYGGGVSSTLDLSISGSGAAVESSSGPGWTSNANNMVLTGLSFRVV